MNVNNRDIGILKLQIIMAEIPEAFYPQMDKLIGNRLNLILWDAQNCGIRCVLSAEIIERIDMANRKTADGFSDKALLFIENAYKLKALRLEIHMKRNRPREISRADENGFLSIRKAQNVSYFIMKLLDIIAIALLTKASEAVQILPDLAGSKPELFGKLNR